MQATVTDRCPWCNSLISHVKFIEVRERIRDEERKRLAEAEAAMRKRLEKKFNDELEVAKRAAAAKEKAEADKRIVTIAADRDRVADKLKQAEAREVTIRKQAQEEADRKAKKDLLDQRALLQKHFDQGALKQQVQFNRERESWQKKMQDLERQLQRKTAGELGDGAEIDLFEALRDAFPGDKITRVDKGQPGADIIHDVLRNGEVCGRIVYDSKNRQSWAYSYVTKLREDQIATKADHAILSTSVFPSGKKELYVESGVIVASPARAVTLVELVRTSILRLHLLGLTKRARKEKTDQLYSYITSESYANHQREAERLAQDISEMDVEEKRQHDNTWKKRGTLVIRMKNVLTTIDTEIAAIVEAPGSAA